MLVPSQVWSYGHVAEDQKVLLACAQWTSDIYPSCSINVIVWLSWKSTSCLRVSRFRWARRAKASLNAGDPVNLIPQAASGEYVRDNWRYVVRQVRFVKHLSEWCGLCQLTIFVFRSAFGQNSGIFVAVVSAFGQNSVESPQTPRRQITSQLSNRGQ